MILSVASFKGGVGKSTTAIHLAACFAEKGSVVLVDGDPNQSATEWAQKGFSPFEVVAPTRARLYRNRDYMIIDSEARPTLSDMSLLASSSDLVLIPTTPDAFAVRGLMRTLAVVEQVEGVNYAVVLTIVPPAVKETEAVRAALKSAGIRVLIAQVRRLVAFQRAGAQGVTVDHVVDPRARDGWRDYQRVSTEVEDLVVQVAGRADGRGAGGVR